MSDESTNNPLGRMNRRTMLGTTTALLGGVVAGVAETRYAQEKPKPAAPAGSAASSAAGPNLAPPVVETKCGKLRGLREGQDSFLPRHSLCGSRAIRPAQAGAAVGRHQERAGLGPGLPGSRTDHGELRRAGVPASLLDRERALSVPERLDSEPYARRRRSRSWCGCTAAASRTARRWSRTPTTAARSASSATSWWSA